MPSSSANMDMRHNDLVDSGSEKNRNQAYHVCHVGRHNRVRSTYHQQNREEEENVHHKLQRVEVAEENLLNSEQSIPVD